MRVDLPPFFPLCAEAEPAAAGYDVADKAPEPAATESPAPAADSTPAAAPAAESTPAATEKPAAAAAAQPAKQKKKGGLFCCGKADHYDS